MAAIAAALPSMGLGLQINGVTISRVMPAYMIPYGIGALIYAPLTRFFSYRVILAIPLVFYSLSSYLCFSASSLDVLLAGRVIMGFSGASIIPLALILIGKMFERGVRGRMVGLLFSTSFISSIVGITLSGLAHWRWLFGIPALGALGTAIGILAIRSKFLSGSHGYSVHYVNALKSSSIRKIFILIFFMSGLYHGVHKWFGLFLDQEYGLTQTCISLVFIGLSLSASFGQILGGFLADKKGRNMAVFSGFILLTAATLLLIGKYPLVFLFGILSLISAGWTIAHNGVSTILTDFPDQFRPEIASLNSSVRFLAGGIGVYLTSFFVKTSFHNTFFVIGLMLGVLLFISGQLLPLEKNT